MSRDQNPNGDEAKKAVALKYDGETAPQVTATGEGALAEEIVRLALEHEVPLFENPALAKMLAEIKLGDQIPEVLYHCIAHIIAFAYRIQGKYPPGWEHDWGPTEDDTGPIWGAESNTQDENRDRNDGGDQSQYNSPSLPPPSPED